MKAVIYARYSSDRQTEQSIEGQLRVCKEYAEREIITIVREYIDRAISGTTDKRPEFQRMIADSSSHSFDCVLVYKLDRFARDRYASAMYKQQLRKNGVRVVSAMENISDAPEGIILEGLLEAMNEYYSAELSQKIKRGMRENAIKGKTTGGNVALGYRIGDDKRLEIDESTAHIVRDIFQMYLDGQTFAEICKHLNALGLKTSRGNDYRSSTISRILSNRRYIGEYTVAGIEEYTECPQIIETEVFEEVQHRLKESIKRHKHHSTSRVYCLTGKLVCSVCGQNMKGESGTSKSGRHYYYYKCSNKCLKPFKAEELEDTVTAMVSDFLASDDVCAEVAQKAYALYQKERNDDSELKRIQKELKETSKKIDNAISAILGGITSETLNETLKALEEKKKALEAEAQNQSLRMPDFNPEHFMYFMRRFAEIQKTQSNKIRLIDAVVNSVVVSDEEVSVLVNIADETKTPPLTEIKSAIQRCSSIVAVGGGKCILYEHHFMYGYIIE